MSSAHASFAPTPSELALTNEIFKTADPQNLGIVTGTAAIGVFGGSKLSPATLGQIWGISDIDNNGFLTKKGVAIAVRLMGWAQKGEVVSETLLTKVGPLPTIQGISLPPNMRSGSATPVPKSPPITLPLKSLPDMSSDDRAKFLRLFVGCGPVNGLLSGDKARDVFLKSKLPLETLGQIWNLADTHSRGSLDSTDFAIGMFLIQLTMSKQLPSIPPTLPPGLYEQASGGKTLPFGINRVEAHHTGGSSGSAGRPLSPNLTGAGSAIGKSPLNPQYTGTLATMKPQTTGTLNAQSTGSFTSTTFSSTPTSTFSPSPSVSAFSTATSTTTSAHWDVTTAEKTSSDKFFDNLDPQRRGFIDGDVAVPFMLESKLPDGILAHVWDLADLNKDGKLTREGFAVAMHLITNKLAGKEVPEILPQSLIPPSMRDAQAPPQSEVQRDLWLLDETPPPSASLPLPQQPQTISSPPPPRALSPQQTPGPSAFQAAASPFNTVVAKPHHNLLDDTSSDDDDGGPVSATGRGQPQPSSLEIGNLQNQLSSTQRSLTATQSDRQALEKQLNTTASQLSQLESQLASTKASYETETRLLADLREKFASQSAAINKAKEELIRNESDLSALKLERNEVQSSVLSGKDEIRDVERKMREVVGEIEGVKKEVEDGRKEGKVASALVEVKKRQLEGLEEELEGVKKDAEAAREEVAQAKREVEVLDGRIAEIEKEKETHQEQQQQQHIADISRAKSPPSIPLPETPADALSPAGSAKSNNPFDRLFGPSSPSHSELPYSSPFPTTQPQPQTSTEAPLGDAVAEKEKEGALSDDEDPFGFNSLSTPTPKANEVESKDIVSPSLTAASAIPLPTSPPPALNLTTSTPTTTITTTLSPTARDFQSPSPSEAEHEFHTPPSTAPLPLSIRSSVIATDDDGDDALLSSAAEQFPALEDVVGGGGEGAANADELPPLKEVVEDDTSDESDDDDEPLGKKIMEKRASMAVEEKMKEGNNGEATNVAASVPAPEKEQSAPFDAIFGTSNTTLTAVAPPSSASLTPTPTGQQSPQSAQAPRRGRPPPPPAPPSRSTPLANKSSASPFDPSSIFTPAPPPPQPQPHTNGVGSGSPTSHKNLVDEAFGIIAPRDGATGLSNAEGVKFDTSFDDTFVFDAADTPQGSHDFGTSKSQASNGLFASAFDPPPSATSAKSAVPTNNGSSPFSSFDDAFGLSSASSAGGASHTNVDTSVSNSLTFDDAFHVGVRDPSSGTTDSEAFGQQQLRRGVNERSPAPVNVPSRTSNDPSTESPVSVSDHGGFHGSGLGHSQSVVRDRETPPRVSSPKFFGRASSPIPRTPARKASTASSSNKGLSPEEKEKTRHSKLSLHFPGFGKSKAKKQAQQQELKSPRTPGAERSSSIGYAGLPSGAAGDVDGDDVDGVKTLVGMGFTRIQAVEALERNSYDVPAALNNLLGSV